MHDEGAIREFPTGDKANRSIVTFPTGTFDPQVSDRRRS